MTHSDPLYDAKFALERNLINNDAVIERDFNSFVSGIKSRFSGNVSPWIEIIEYSDYCGIQLLIPQWFIDSSRNSLFGQISLLPGGSHWYYASCASKSYPFFNSCEAFDKISAPLREQWIESLNREIRHCDRMHIKNILG